MDRLIEKGGRFAAVDAKFTEKPKASDLKGVVQRIGRTYISKMKPEVQTHKRTGVVIDPRYADHCMGPGQLECPRRLEAIRAVLEVDGVIRAFAWVTFRDYKLALWYTLHLPPGFSYLVYIFVHPAIARQGVGSYLLGSVMAAVRDLGCSKMVSGMYADWETSIRLHTRMGFRVQRRLNQCRWLSIFPVPPKEEPIG